MGATEGALVVGLALDDQLTPELRRSAAMLPSVLCGDWFEFCVCSQTVGHVGAHSCICDGSWTRDEHGRAAVVRLPFVDLSWLTDDEPLT